MMSDTVLDTERALERSDNIRKTNSSSFFVMFSKDERRKIFEDGVLLPKDSAFLECWDAVMVIALATIVLMLPYTVAFLEYPKFDGSKVDNATVVLFFVDRLTEFIFLADIMIQFYTAVYDSKNAVWVTDRAEIRKIYFGNLLAGEPGDFWNHVVASFPYGLIGYLALGRATQGNLIICK